MVLHVKSIIQPFSIQYNYKLEQSTEHCIAGLYKYIQFSHSIIIIMSKRSTVLQKDTRTLLTVF